MSRKQTGWTLIELMIVVMLASLLMAIAVPGYRQFSQRAHRTDATIQLMRVTAQQERFYLQNGTYASNAQLTLAPPAGLGFTGTSDRGDYTIAIAPDAAGLAVGYTVTATPIAAGSGGTQSDDTDCTSFIVDQNGRMGANGGYVPAEVEECWR